MFKWLNRGKQRGDARHPVKWTFLELTGLAVASFLILWPVVTLTVDLIRPASVARAADLSVTKTVDKANPAPGDTVTYTITVTNTSGQTNILSVVDNVPAQLTVVSANVISSPPTTSSTPQVSGNLVQWSTIIAADTVSASFNIVATVNSNVTGGTSVSNVASGTAQFGTGVPANSLPAVFTVATNVNATATAQANATATAQAGTGATATAQANANATATAQAQSGNAATATAQAQAAAATATAQARAAATATAQRGATLTAAAGSGGGGGGGGGGSNPTPAPTNTVPGATGGQLTVNPATITAVLRTLTPQPGGGLIGAPAPATSPAGGGTTTTSAPATSAPAATTAATSGVVSGSFSSNAAGLSGSQVSLVRRVSGKADETIKTALIDSRNQYFFTGVPPTDPGQVYFVRYSNPDPGSGVLRLFDTNPFSFKGGNYQVPGADLTDVRIGAPGSNNGAFQAPLTLSWSARSSEDRYSITVFRANGGPALDSGNLGSTTAFTIPSGQLNEGNYFAQINVLNPLGTGISNRQFSFRLVGGIILQPTATRSAALATNTPVPATTAAPAAATTTAAPTATTVVASQSQVDATATPSATVVPGTQSTGGSLPRSGGELPIAGLLLAGFTLLARRIRLVRQTR